jgi:predicted dehydrogenase
VKEIRIGLVGPGWMGRTHVTAFDNALLTFGPEPARPVMQTVCARTEDAARAAAAALGFRRWCADWRALVADPAVDLVDIATPSGLHAEIALAALAAGKHVWCEAPLATCAEDARRLAEAAESAGVTTLVGFSYLKNPTQDLARRLIAEGEIGEITAIRGTFDQEVPTDPAGRLERGAAGPGALGELGSHLLSLALTLAGEIVEVCGMTGDHEDIAQFLAVFANGALGHFVASRLGSGGGPGLTYEVQGTEGALCYDQARMNELQFYRRDQPRFERGYKLIYSGPDHGAYGAFFPIPGVGLGYGEQKTIEVRALIEAVAAGRPAEPDFRFGYRVGRVVEAALRSAAERRWVRVDEIA